MPAAPKRHTLEAKYERGRSYLVPGELLNGIIEAITATTPIAGDNMEFQHVGNGIILSARPGGTAGAVPWQPYISGGPGAWKARITPGLLRVEGTVTSVTDALKIFDTSAGNRVYLKAVIASGVVGTVSAMVGGNWPDYPSRVEFDANSPFEQKAAYLELGTVKAVAGVLKMTDIWHSGHVALVDAIIAGRLAKVFVPGN